MKGKEKFTKTENSLRNLSTAVLSYFITILFSFAGRIVFVRLLAAEYLGLSGLFSNVLSMLSLAELGVGTAIAYSLYGPLQSGDVPLIQAIMRLYRKLYRIIGSVVFLLGAALTPFLPWLIKDMPSDMPGIYVYYLLYVVHSGLSYFFTYKRTLIICDQKQYISTATTTVSGILTSVAHIVVLILTHNYLLYLLAGIAVTVGENLLISAIADRMYPYLREKTNKELPGEMSRQMRKNIYAMLCHKIGTVVVYSIDNLVIARFVGLSAVGLYSNYTLVLSGIGELLRKFFGSVAASVGMLIQEKDEMRSEKVLYRMLFLNFWMYAFCSVAFFCLVQPFISLWAGEKYLLPLTTAGIISVNFYLTGARQTVLTFRDAAGVFWYDRYKALAEAAVNAALSIPLGIRLGVGGVVLGTIGATLAVPFWFEGHILFKHFFEKSAAEYLRKQFFYAGLALAAGAVTFRLCQWTPGNGFASFVFKMAICTAVPNAMFLAVFFHSENLRYYKTLYKNLRNM